MKSFLATAFLLLSCLHGGAQALRSGTNGDLLIVYPVNTSGWPRSNQIPLADTNLIRISVQGDPSNHVRPEMTLHWPKDNPMVAEVAVECVELSGSDTVGQAAWDGNFTQADIDAIMEIARRASENDWPYYLPTNGLCGPLELQDVNGVRIPARDPKVSSYKEYPVSFSFKEAKANYFRQFMSYSGPDFPIGLQHPRNTIAQFKLTNYFAITNAGEYLLTVWPKLYSRDRTNRDLCVRVDLPPVTINFEWPRASPK
jgi:hypothetical protein